MPQQQPKTVGIRRTPSKGNIHPEVKAGIQAIADAEDKTYSYVLAEIVYKFFGLEVTKHAVKIARTRRKASTRKGNRRSIR